MQKSKLQENNVFFFLIHIIMIVYFSSIYIDNNYKKYYKISIHLCIKKSRAEKSFVLSSFLQNVYNCPLCITKPVCNAICDPQVFDFNTAKYF
jgi:hypothetical protein